MLDSSYFRYLIGLILISVIITLWVDNRNLTTTNKDLETKATLLDQTLKEEQSKFKDTVLRLEAELNRYVIDASAYQCSVRTKSEAIDNETREAESRICKELETNSSTDNQLEIARRIINEFNKNK